MGAPPFPGRQTPTTRKFLDRSHGFPEVSGMSRSSFSGKDTGYAVRWCRNYGLSSIVHVMTIATQFHQARRFHHPGLFQSLIVVPIRSHISESPAYRER